MQIMQAHICIKMYTRTKNSCMLEGASLLIGDKARRGAGQATGGWSIRKRLKMSVIKDVLQL